jgi:hypothetical protein
LNVEENCLLLRRRVEESKKVEEEGGEAIGVHEKEEEVEDEERRESHGNKGSVPVHESVERTLMKALGHAFADRAHVASATPDCSGGTLE